MVYDPTDGVIFMPKEIQKYTPEFKKLEGKPAQIVGAIQKRKSDFQSALLLGIAPQLRAAF